MNIKAARVLLDFFLSIQPTVTPLKQTSLVSHALLTNSYQINMRFSTVFAAALAGTALAHPQDYNRDDGIYRAPPPPGFAGPAGPRPYGYNPNNLVNGVAHGLGEAGASVVGGLADAGKGVAGGLIDATKGIASGLGVVAGMTSFILISYSYLSFFNRWPF